MDSQLRELERRAASGNLADRVELLRARLRGGVTSSEHVKLAAFCGHEAAVALVGDAKHAFYLAENQNDPSWRIWKNLLRGPLGKQPAIAACYVAVCRAYQSDMQLPDANQWWHRTDWDVEKLLDAVYAAAGGGQASLRGCRPPLLSIMSDKYKHHRWRMGVTYHNEACDQALSLLYELARPNPGPFWTTAAKCLRRTTGMYCAVEMELAIPDYYPAPTEEQDELKIKIQDDRRRALSQEISTILGNWAVGDIDEIPKLH